MVNQQLLDYLREQLRSGVNRKDLKDTLLSVGWQEVDINEAFEIIDKELTQNTDTIKNQDSNLVNLKNIVANSLNSNNQSINSVDNSNKNVNNLNSSPQYISKDDFVFAKSDSITMKDQKQMDNSNLNTIQPQQIKIESLPKNHKKFKIILYIIFSLVIIGLLILTFFMYQKNNELENKLTETLARSGDLENQSQGISQTINDLQKQILSLK
ncbi:MAG: hypothetical protein N2Z85_01875, partial [Patescibacteria group bacterium]|nr:hypothetical protein [Patescibacteria group bacterium]